MKLHFVSILLILQISIELTKNIDFSEAIENLAKRHGS